MNCMELKEAFGLHCSHVADDLVYLETNLSLPLANNLIGAYVQDIGRGRLRISDNADTLFEALSLGMKASNKRRRNIEKIAAEFGITISDAGEISVACASEEAPYAFARYVEASFAIGAACSNWVPQPTSVFERSIAKILKEAFPKKVKRNFEVRGASGHQLKFHFALNPGEQNMMLIQTIGATDDSPNWNAVYGTMGKMIDVRNADRSVRRTVVIEHVESVELERACTALAESAEVIVFQDRARFIEALAA